MFFPCFSFLLVLFGCNCAKCKYDAAMIGPGPLARNQHRVSGDQQDSLDSGIQLDSLGQTLASCNLDVKFCKHGPATVLIEFLNNRLCHYGVFG
jgi:hypothetical protein